MFPKFWGFILVVNQILMSKSEFIVELKDQPMPNAIHISANTGICAGNETQHGKCTWQNHNLKCYGVIFNVTSFQFNLLMNTQEIVFCGWPKEVFDPSILKEFSKLNKLHIENGRLLHIEKDFPHLKHLKHINISYTRLSHLQSTIFRRLPTIKTIDLRRNQLNYYDGSLQLPSKFQGLYLSENPYNCSKNFKWLMNNSRTKHIIDRHLLRCSDFNKINVVTVMSFRMSLREMCHKNIELRNCTCTLSFIVLDVDEVWRPMYTINCNNLNLTRLPTSVPENTTTFYAQYNQISEIQPFSNSYRSVHNIYLDYNQISSIETLESDNILEHFRLFSLKGNQLTKLPVYLLNNALERNHLDALYLSENPWRCECNFMLKFQELLQIYRETIKDASVIQCVKRENDDTIFYPVLALKRNDVCISIEYTIQPIDMLSVFLAISVIFIVFKLIYDYYNFRAYGHLPWIVTKMP